MLKPALASLASVGLGFTSQNLSAGRQSSLKRIQTPEDSPVLVQVWKGARAAIAVELRGLLSNICSLLSYKTSRRDNLSLKMFRLPHSPSIFY